VRLDLVAKEYENDKRKKVFEFGSEFSTDFLCVHPRFSSSKCFRDFEKWR
jgi:hypothetical protein